ncbi:hypothetical protein [Thermocrinis sp.]
MRYASLEKRALALILSIKEIFFGEIGYYSSAMTYKFLMVLGSLFVLVGFLSSFLPFFYAEKVFQLINQLPASHGSKVFEKLQGIYAHRKVGSLIFVLMSYFFTISYTKVIAKSVSFILKEPLKLRETFFWIFVPIYILFFSFTILLGSSLISLLYTLAPKGISIAVNLLKPILFLPLVYFTYWFFLRGLMKPSHVLEASLYFLIALSLINLVFAKFLVKLMELNPLYTILGSVLLFLVWLELVFSFLLGGVYYAKRLN